MRSPRSTEAPRAMSTQVLLPGKRETIGRRPIGTTACVVATPCVSRSIKKTLARLLETYAEEAGYALHGAGSWTLRRKPKERAVEPDECYIVGPTKGRREPDLAIEVAWTAGGIDKLDVYRELGVREVWIWEDGALTVHVLRKGGYRTARKSALFPALDLQAIAALATAEDQTAAVRTFRAALRARPSRA